LIPDGIRYGKGVVGTAETLDAIRGIVAYNDGKLQLVPLTFDAWKILVRWIRVIERAPDFWESRDQGDHD
jgi:hypothetical protein